MYTAEVVVALGGAKGAPPTSQDSHLVITKQYTHLKVTPLPVTSKVSLTGMTGVEFHSKVTNHLFLYFRYVDF